MQTSISRLITFSIDFWTYSSFSASLASIQSAPSLQSITILAAVKYILNLSITCLMGCCVNCNQALIKSIFSWKSQPSIKIDWPVSFSYCFIFQMLFLIKFLSWVNIFSFSLALNTVQLVLQRSALALQNSKNFIYHLQSFKELPCLMNFSNSLFHISAPINLLSKSF